MIHGFAEAPRGSGTRNARVGERPNANSAAPKRHTHWLGGEEHRARRAPRIEGVRRTPTHCLIRHANQDTHRPRLKPGAMNFGREQIARKYARPGKAGRTTGRVAEGILRLRRIRRRGGRRARGNNRHGATVPQGMDQAQCL